MAKPRAVIKKSPRAAPTRSFVHIFHVNTLSSPPSGLASQFFNTFDTNPLMENRQWIIESAADGWVQVQRWHTTPTTKPNSSRLNSFQRPLATYESAHRPAAVCEHLLIVLDCIRSKKKSEEMRTQGPLDSQSFAILIYLNIVLFQMKKKLS